MTSQDFNPEKYKNLCRILCNKLIATGSPASMLQYYLSAFTKGTCPDDEDDSVFAAKEFDPRKALIEKSIKGKTLLFLFKYQGH